MAKKQNPSEKNIKKHQNTKDFSFVLGFGLTLFFLAYCLIFLPARYETNDELANVQRLVAQGNIAPEATSPVLSQTLGYILVGLYKAAPSIPWYGIVLYTALLIGISLISRTFIRHADRWLIFFCYPLFLFYMFHCFTFVSFTAAALIAQLGAFLALLEWTIIEKAPIKNHTIYALLLTFGLILGYMLRWELALYFMIFALPILLYIKKEHLKRAWPFVLILLAFILVDRAMTYYSTTQEEKEYLVYNELRRVFHDTEKGAYHGDSTIAVLEGIGWTVNDWSMFKRWNLYDEKKFNTDTLKSFLKGNNHGTSKTSLGNILHKMKKSYLKSINYTNTLFFAVIFILLFKFTSIRQLSRRQMAKACLTLGFVLCIILFFSYYRFSPRIFVPVYIFFLGLVFLMVSISPRERNSKLKQKHSFQIVLTLIGGLFLIFSYKTAGVQAAGMTRALNVSMYDKIVIQKCLSEVKIDTQELSPVIINMNPPDALGREFAYPLKELSDFNNGLFIMPTGTSINSPRYYRILKSLNLSSGRDFLKWTIDNKQALFVFIVRDKKFHMSHVHMWETYYNHRISPQKKVRLKPVYDFRNKNGNGLLFYQMKLI